MKIISYSLFGYNKERQANCFVFADYLRGLSVNIRLARVLYPDWTIRLHTDKSTYEGLKNILDSFHVQIEVCEDAKLTKAMLWRMKPLFDKSVTHVLCRDLDSPLTYREVQAVKYWLNRDKSCHAITDSISHTVPLLGGMIGFVCDYFKQRTGYDNWDSMVNSCNYDWEDKGSDQTFLTNFIYPKFAQHGNDSITQHYILGMPNSFLSDYHNAIQDLELDNVPYEFKSTNDLCGHIGAAGYYSQPMLSFILKYKDLFSDLWKIESQHKDIYYWCNEGI